MTRYDLAIFDLDGTLSDSFPWFLRVINTMAERHGFKRITEDEIATFRDKTSREIVAALEVPTWRLPLIARDMRRMKTANLVDIPLFPGIIAMLDALRTGGIQLAMVSSDSESNVRRALGPAAALICCYACGASLFGKTGKFRQVQRRLGIDPHRILCIGDEVRDVQAARKAGYDFGAVGWGYASMTALARLAPALTFTDPDDLVRKLLRDASEPREES